MLQSTTQERIPPAAPALFPPLFQALAANLPPSDLRAFLSYALAEIEAPRGEQAASEAPLTTSLDCRANELVPAEAVRGATPVPEITKDSETPEVAAWCRAAGLNASVVGAWVWVDPYAQVHATKAELDLVLPAAGFQYSGRRQSYFHACTVSSRREPGDKRRGGKLERFHNVVGVADYNPRTYNPAPFRRGRQRKAVAP